MTKTYTVSGQSKTRPTDLPDGFTVEVTEGPFEAKIGAYSDNDSHHLEIREISSGSLKIAFTSDTYERKEPWLNVGKSQVVTLRNALNEWLDDGLKSRVFRDRDGDLWFEVSPGQFISEDGWQSAIRYFDNDGSSESEVRQYAPVTDVTSEYPRP